MTRRDMISGIGMLAAAAPAANAAASDAAPAGFRLGVASYSFREFQRVLAIKMIKQVGVTDVSVKQDFHLPFTLTPAEVTRAAGEFKRAGLTIVSLGNTDLKSTEAEMRKYFEHAKACGVSMLVAAPLHETLGPVEKLAKEYDMRIAIHTHGPEDANFPSPKVVLEAVKGMDPRMGLCMDVGHSMRAGADVVQEVANAGPRLLDMHFKDLKDGKVAASQCPVGEGVMPVVALFKQLQRIGYRGHVNLEYEVEGDDPMPGMLRSLGYMKGVMAGLAG